MRRFLIAVLLSGAAASPALAQDWNDHGHHHDQQNNGRAQPQQQQRGDGHAERGNGGNVYRQQAPQFVRQQPVQIEEGQRGAWGGQRFEGRAQGQVQVEERQRGNWGGPRFEARPQGQVQVQQQAYGYRGYRGGFNGQVAQPEQVRNWNGQRNWTGVRGDYSQGQVVPQYREGNRYARNDWDRDWRNDRRYDWRHYRDHHRSLFHIGLYYDPFGYGYQSFNIGFRLAPVYFGEQYWIDPAMYELPYPPPGTQWIRYWNDAVLVDVYSGEVVDVIHDFFW
ncbi:MAG TPA: RcnB family protein [Sphingomicrobium sp.]|nr:RcnB family protein [Sphingomicrobium sp.]